MSKRYDEQTLAPMEIPARWWFFLPLKKRLRIMDRTGLEPAGGGVLIGQVQETLVRRGFAAEATTFMVAMQACYDQDRERYGPDTFEPGSPAVVTNTSNERAFGWEGPLPPATTSAAEAMLAEPDDDDLPI